jgi:hypothetical protein
VQFFVNYIIVPPYESVPSYEQFREKVSPRLQEHDYASVLASMDHEGDDDHCQASSNMEKDPMILTLAHAGETAINIDMEYHVDHTLILTPIKRKSFPAEFRVKAVYKCINQITGSLGGNGSGGPSYGELTEGSMQRIVDYLILYCCFGPLSRFLDIGAGQGKPNFHVAQNPGVHLSIGVEVEAVRWEVRHIYISVKYRISIYFTCHVLYACY